MFNSPQPWWHRPALALVISLSVTACNDAAKSESRDDKAPVDNDTRGGGAGGTPDAPAPSIELVPDDLSKPAPGPDGGTPGGTPVVKRQLKLARSTYLDRLAAMWMGESIANWTGLITEGRHNEPPYLTDKDWGGRYEHSRAGSAVNVLSYNFQDPWLSDDDTDMEYVHLAAMTKRGDPYLNSDDIRQAWLRHTEPGKAIWVANLAAQTLMFQTPFVAPPATSMLAANDQSLMIDAQLTTEFFGAFAPGMPRRALALADLPIRTTASGYAEHASQFHVLLYSLALIVDTTLPPREQILWLAKTARKFIPDTSKSAVIYDFILAQYLANPDVNDWEKARDALDAKFGPLRPGGAQDPKFLYLEWYESPVNFATGLMALLYGEGDLKRTIRVGTLSGWDSDNGTATMGGLLGLMLGTEGIRKQFPDTKISGRYRIVTRTGFASIDDTFEAMAGRMAPLAERVIMDGGGSLASGVFSIPLEDIENVSPGVDNLRMRDDAQSLNNAFRRANKAVMVTAEDSAIVSGGDDLPGYATSSASSLNVLVDGLEFDSSGSDRKIVARDVQAFPGEPATAHHVALSPKSPQGSIKVEVIYPEARPISGIRFVEGPSWFEESTGLTDITVEVRNGGQWKTAKWKNQYDARPLQAFEIHDLRFENTMMGDAIRLGGKALAGGTVVTLCEVEATLAL